MTVATTNTLRADFEGSRAGFRQARAGTLSVPVLIDLVQLTDCALLLAGGMVAFIATGLSRTGQPVGEFVVATLVGTAFVVLLQRRDRAYTLDRLASGFRQFRPGGVALAYAGALSALCLMILRLPVREASMWAGAWMLGSSAFLALFRTTLSGTIQSWMRAGLFDHKVAVIGVNALSKEFINRVSESGLTRTKVIGLYEDGQEPTAGFPEDGLVRGDLDTLMLDCRLRTVDSIVIALPSTSLDEIDRITTRLRPCVADLYLLSDVWNVDAASSHFADIGKRRVVPVAKKPLRDWREVQKAVFDRTIAVVLLTMLLPLLLLAAAAVKLTSPGPILFRQMRMGFNNNLFQIYKFRTMHVHMTDRLADRQTTRNDRRVTRVGRIMRKLSIDELPQLINVVRGEMSLVGPRPHAPGTRLGTRRVDEVVGGYAQRHRVKPGITGLAQINGYRGEMATEEQVRMRVQYDLEYIRTWSLWLDVKILLFTISREIHSRRAF